MSTYTLGESMLSWNLHINSMSIAGTQVYFSTDPVAQAGIITFSLYTDIF